MTKRPTELRLPPLEEEVEDKDAASLAKEPRRRPSDPAAADNDDDINIEDDDNNNIDVSSSFRLPTGKELRRASSADKRRQTKDFSTLTPIPLPPIPLPAPEMSTRLATDEVVAGGCEDARG